MARSQEANRGEVPKTVPAAQWGHGEGPAVTGTFCLLGEGSRGLQSFLPPPPFLLSGGVPTPACLGFFAHPLWALGLRLCPPPSMPRPRQWGEDEFGKVSGALSQAPRQAEEPGEKMVPSPHPATPSSLPHCTHTSPVPPPMPRAVGRRRKETKFPVFGTFAHHTVQALSATGTQR